MTEDTHALGFRPALGAGQIEVTYACGHILIAPSAEKYPEQCSDPRHGSGSAEVRQQ